MRAEGSGTPRHEARLNSVELSIVHPPVEIRKAEGLQAPYTHSSESEAPQQRRHADEGTQALPYTAPSGVPTFDEQKEMEDEENDRVPLMRTDYAHSGMDPASARRCIPSPYIRIAYMCWGGGWWWLMPGRCAVLTFCLILPPLNLT